MSAFRKIGKRLCLVLAAFIVFNTPPLADDDTVDFVRCLKAIESADSYSREILFGACITAVERHCTAPVIVDAGAQRQCFLAQAEPLSAFNNDLFDRLPYSPPETLSGFRKRSYARAWERLHFGPVIEIEREASLLCRAFQGTCDFMDEVMRTSDLFLLARASDTPIVSDPAR